MPISDQDLEEALGIAAKIIDLYGYTYWPVFERLETELTERNKRRSRVMARLSRSRPVRGKPTKGPRPARRLHGDGIENSQGNQGGSGVSAFETTPFCPSTAPQTPLQALKRGNDR